MKDSNDEELQDMIGKNLKTDMSLTDDRDLKTYSLLFDALAKQPDASLPYNFSSKVTANLLARKSRAGELRLYFTIGLSLFVLTIATVIYLSSMSVSPTFQLTVLLSKYKWITIFAIATVLIIQYLDKKLVRKNM